MWKVEKMKYQTKVSKMKKFEKGLEHTIHGEKLSDLVGEISFSSGIFFLLSGRKPNEIEGKLFDAMLLSIIDHGMGTLSSMATRFVASGRTGMSSAVAAGMLSIGDLHGGAMQKAMEQYEQLHSMSEEERVAVVTDMIRDKKLIYGFGHKVYKSGDPRVRVLLELVSSLGYKSRHLFIKDFIEGTFSEVKGKVLHMNIDGVIALLLLDFGFDARLSKGIFLIGRCAGLVAQANEEMVSERAVRRVPEEMIEDMR